MISVYDYLKDSIPADHCRQSRGLDMAKDIVRKTTPETMVDLGCGAGNSVDHFKSVFPSVKWIGIDIGESPEVNQRSRGDAEYLTFDGVHLPFSDGSIDFIYSNQVLEHVRYPELLLAEVSRVLKEDGVFVGQTSQLEPYHSYSYWNFTAFGFKKICEEAGLSVDELRPGIDARTLFDRAYLGRPPEYSKWFSEESPLNEDIERSARADGKGIRIINFRKIMSCGQFCFICTKGSRK